jgi:ABC-type glutathione transport system ATPase component
MKEETLGNNSIEIHGPVSFAWDRSKIASFTPPNPIDEKTGRKKSRKQLSKESKELQKEANAEMRKMPEPPPSLVDISLQVKKGELIAIVGPVGCGKSTLLSAILGEVNIVGRDGDGRDSSGNKTLPPVSVDGTVAYCKTTFFFFLIFID